MTIKIKVQSIIMGNKNSKKYSTINDSLDILNKYNCIPGKTINSDINDCSVRFLDFKEKYGNKKLKDRSIAELINPKYILLSSNYYFYFKNKVEVFGIFENGYLVDGIITVPDADMFMHVFKTINNCNYQLFIRGKEYGLSSTYSRMLKIVSNPCNPMEYSTNILSDISIIPVSDLDFDICKNSCTIKVQISNGRTLFKSKYIVTDDTSSGTSCLLNIEGLIDSSSNI